MKNLKKINILMEKIMSLIIERKLDLKRTEKLLEDIINPPPRKGEGGITQH